MTSTHFEGEGINTIIYNRMLDNCINHSINY